MVRGTAVGLAKAPGDIAVTQAGVVLVVAGEIVCSVIHLNSNVFLSNILYCHSHPYYHYIIFHCIQTNHYHIINITFSVPRRSRPESINRIWGQNRVSLVFSAIWPFHLYRFLVRLIAGVLWWASAYWLRSSWGCGRCVSAVRLAYRIGVNCPY